jgi:hypothetical protein
MEEDALTPEQLAHIERVRAEMAEADKTDPGWMDRIGSAVGAVGGDLATGAKEALPQIVRGGQEALNAMSGGTHAMARWLNDNVLNLDGVAAGLGIGGDGTNTLKFGEGAMPARPESVTGTLVNDVSQFVAGLGFAGKALKAAGVARAVTAPGVIAQGMAKGAIADASAFDAHEERLSNLVESFPSLSNPVTEYLASDPTDTQSEGRFKNALEGMLIGGPIEGLVYSVRAIRARRAGNMSDAQAALDEADKVAPKVSDDPLTAAPEEAPRAAGDEAAKARQGSHRGPEEDGAVTAPEGAPKGEDQLGLSLEGGGPRPDSPRETFGDAEGDMKPGAAAARGQSPDDIPPKRPDADNDSFKPAKKIVEVDDVALRQIAEASVNEYAWGQGRAISGIRTDLMTSEADINNTMSALRVVYREEAAKATGGNAEGVRSWANVERNADALADIVGQDPRLLVQRMQAIHKETFHADAELKLYRDMLVTVNERLVGISEVVADPLGGLGKYASRAEAYADFAQHYELLANMQLMYKGIQTNFARTMNAMKLTSEARQGVLPADVSDIFEGGARNMEALARKIAANKGNVKGNAQLTRGGFANNFLGSVNEYWINSILSGPKTHAVNVTAGLINSVFVPAEKMIAGALRMDSAAGREQFMEGGLHYVGMVASARDAVGLAYKAFKRGDAILDPGKGTVEHKAQISAANWNVQDPGLSMAVNGLGSLVRLPSRFLTAEDEFLKQLTYRAAIRSSAYREGLQNGLLFKPAEFGSLVSQRLDESVLAGGSASTVRALDGVSPLAIQKHQEALEMAREVTFTGDLKTTTRSGGPSIGESVQTYMAAHPGARMIMPFVRTPTNIMRQVWNHTPGLNLVRKQYADDFTGANGPAAQAKARAQMLTGTGLWTAATSYVLDGSITGAGPADPDIRKSLEQTGWKPYSIKTENEDGTVSYRSYNRFDPFGMFFGLVADFNEAAGAWPEQDLEERATQVAVALAKNLNNKSYLSGLVNAVGAMAEPGRRMESFFKGLAGGFVPTVLQQSFNNDPHLREARSVVDAMRRKMPGLSEGLDPQRNVLGEKQYIPPSYGPDWMSPITDTLHPGGAQPLTEEWKRTVQADVYDELARQTFLHNSPLKAAPAKVHGVDLTQYRANSGYTAADRYAELAGTVKNDGKAMKDRLAELIRSPDYRNKLSDGDFDVNGSRIDAIRSVVAGYREMALQALMRETPELYHVITDARRNEALMKLQPKDRKPLEVNVRKRPE